MNILYADSERNLEEPDKVAVKTFEDLDFNPILDVMAGGDRDIRETCRKVMMHGRTDLDTIKLRQAVMKDATENEDQFRSLASLTTEIEKSIRKRMFWTDSDRPGILVYEGRFIISSFIDYISKIRPLFDYLLGRKISKQMQEYIKDFNEKYNDQWVKKTKGIIERTDFDHRLYAYMGTEWDLSINQVKLLNHQGKGRPLKLLTKSRKWTLPGSCEGCGQEFSSFRETIIREVAGMVHELASSIYLKVCRMRDEFLFYAGAVNLIKKIRELGAPLTFPVIGKEESPSLKFDDLVETSLMLRSGKIPISNSLDSAGRITFVISGPNSGGKSVFARSIGQALILFQSGLPVPATYFRSTVFNCLHAYFSKAEQQEIGRGRYEGELSNIQNIVTSLNRKDIIILNEPLASTNQYDGAMIMREVIQSFEKGDIMTFATTHFYHLASWASESDQKRRTLLLAEHLQDGQRTFRIKEAQKALNTSWALDVWKKMSLARHTGDFNLSDVSGKTT